MCQHGKTVVSTYESDSGLTRADIWALAAITGTNFGLNRAGGDRTFFEMTHYGRVNCGDDQTGGTDHELPGPNLDTQELLDFFADNFDFDDQDTVAIMGGKNSVSFIVIITLSHCVVFIIIITFCVVYHFIIT